jgi:hypothetical protein
MNNLVSLDIVMLIQSAKVTLKQPEEVRVQRQLKSWLEPGWCMTPQTGSACKVNRKGKYMFGRIAGVLTLLWLLWLVTSYPVGGFIHILLVLAIVIVLVRLIHGVATIVIARKENRGLTGSRAAALIDPDDLARFEGKGGLESPGRGKP